MANGKRGRKPGITSVEEDKRKVGRMICLEAEVWDKIDRQCEREGISRSAYFRRLLAGCEIAL